MLEINSRLDNLVGTVIPEGVYILINETSFEFMTSCGVGRSEKRVQPYQMIRRAVPNDPLLIITAYKRVLFNPPL